MLETYNATIKIHETIAPQIYRIVFSLNKPLIFVPGQYVLLDVKDGYRQYSISSSPSHTDEVEIVVDVSPMGLGSKYLLKLTLGDSVSFRAPLGVFTLTDTSVPKIFLATGTGIAPIKSMIEYLSEQQFQKPYHLFWGLKSKADIYYAKDLEIRAKQNPQFTYHYCLSREEEVGSVYIKGHITDCLNIMKNTLNELSSYEFYVCGRQLMIDQMQQYLLSNWSIDKTKIFSEKYT